MLSLSPDGFNCMHGIQDSCAFIISRHLYVQDMDVQY